MIIEPVDDVGLAAEFGMGRTPVREAVKQLEPDHLVVSFPRRWNRRPLAALPRMPHQTREPR